MRLISWTIFLKEELCGSGFCVLISTTYVIISVPNYPTLSPKTGSEERPNQILGGTPSFGASWPMRVWGRMFDFINETKNITQPPPFFHPHFECMTVPHCHGRHTNKCAMWAEGHSGITQTSILLHPSWPLWTWGLECVSFLVGSLNLVFMRDYHHHKWSIFPNFYMGILFWYILGVLPKHCTSG